MLCGRNSGAVLQQVWSSFPTPFFTCANGARNKKRLKRQHAASVGIYATNPISSCLHAA